MCGINGFTGQADPTALRRMHAATKHRGPDDEGFFESPGISFAHNRLSIIDLSTKGHQPMHSADGRYTIIFNGEIYNYRELALALEQMGHAFTSASDTEVLLAGFGQWGEAVFSKLNGIFACAIWDQHEQQLTLVRDQIGVKPLYYCWDGTRLAFSSEIKALLELDIPRTLDTEAMNAYFRLLYVPAPRTMFKEVKKLPPGHVLTVQANRMNIRKWWKLSEGSTVPYYQDAVQGVRERALTAVRRQLISERPLGVFLSGGVDSTAVLALMRQIDPSGTIKTFTVGYEHTDEATKYNEDARVAALTAKHFGTEHHEHLMTAQEVLGCLHHVARHMDEPVANHVQTSTYALAKFAKPLITVALGGDGGDELFGGYPRYWYAAFAEQFRHLPKPVQSSGRALLRAAGYSSLAERLSISSGLERQLSFVAQKEDVVSRILPASINNAGQMRPMLEPHCSPSWRDPVNMLMAVDLATWMPDESLVRTDKLAMAHALEARVPLLDPDLVSYASRIPSAWKVYGRDQGKRVFVDALRDMLPSHVLHQEKRAWMSPMSKWIRGPLQPFVREVLSPAFGGAPADLIHFFAVQALFEDHLAKRGYHLNVIWAVVCFQLWWKEFKPSWGGRE
jgi:asparagine synthase (glutamine-hydrolysing)